MQEMDSLLAAEKVSSPEWQLPLMPVHANYSNPPHRAPFPQQTWNVLLPFTTRPKALLVLGCQQVTLLLRAVSKFASQHTGCAGLGS